MFLFVLNFLAAATLTAHATERNPWQQSWCSAYLTTRAPAPAPRQVLERDLEVFKKRAHNFATVYARADQVEKDLSLARNGLITYGEEIRGKENIRAYLFELGQTTRDFDDKFAPQLSDKLAHSDANDVVNNFFMTAGSATMIYFFSNWAQQLAANFSWPAIPAAIVAGGAAWAFSETATRTAHYVAATASENARNSYENKYNRGLASRAVSWAKDLLAELDKEIPDVEQFSLHADTYFIPRTLADEFIEAMSAGRAPRAVPAHLDRTQTAVDVDQYFYYDPASNEPVLLNFIRLTKAYSDVNGPRRRIEIPATAEDEFPLNLQPVPVPVRVRPRPR